MKRGIVKVTYRSWKDMHRRCYNPNCSRYAYYGERGIKVCKRWGKFANFLSDMGRRPQGTTLDRINNNKGYSPSNCRWATSRQQNNNSRNCHFITFNGHTKTTAQWAKELGLNASSFRWRIYENWPLERALTEPRNAAFARQIRVAK